MLYLLSHYGEVPMKRALRLPRRDDVLPRLLHSGGATLALRIKGGRYG